MDGITLFKIDQDMKKLLTVLILLVVISESYSQKRFSLTFLASPQMSWLRSDAKTINGGKTFLGFGYGVEGDIFLHSPNYTLSTGMTVCTTGGSLTYDRSASFSGKVLPAGTVVEYDLTWLEFPLALKMRTRSFFNTRYYAQFGFTNWFNIKAKGTSSDRSFQKETIEHEIRIFNLGLNIGGGLEYNLGYGNALTCGLIYSNGFTDVTTTSGITLKVVRFRLGFVF
jgi:hypothetical protein